MRHLVPLAVLLLPVLAGPACEDAPTDAPETTRSSLIRAPTTHLTPRPPPAAPPTPERWRRPPAPSTDPRRLALAPPGFTRMGRVRPGDWLDDHEEHLQTFEDYVASSPVRPRPGRETIEFRLLGPTTRAERRLTRQLVEWTRVFFQLPVRMGAPLSLQGITSRTNAFSGQRQYLAAEILRDSLHNELYRDAMCLIGVTFEDLYPHESWNYVFGWASLRHRLAVYSLRRFLPGFYGMRTRSFDRREVLQHGMKLVSHEIGHVLGVTHCVEYRCLMNGMNGLSELDQTPLFLCPSCRRKIQGNIGFDVLTRYREMASHLGRLGLADEGRWVARQIARQERERRSRLHAAR